MLKGQATTLLLEACAARQFPPATIAEVAIIGAALDLGLTSPDAVIARIETHDDAGLDGYLLALAADVALVQGTMDVIGGAA